MTEDSIRSSLGNLLELMKQRDSLDALEESSSVAVLRTVLDAVINDSCRYVSEQAACFVP
jgi:hypothetical protein